VRTGPKFYRQRKLMPGKAAQQKRIKEEAARAKRILADEAGQGYYEAVQRRLGKRNTCHTAIYDYFS